MRSNENRQNISGEGGLGTRDICLSPIQTQHLLFFLEAHCGEIQELAEEQVKDARKILGRVYSLILSWRKDDKESAEQDR